VINGELEAEGSREGFRFRGTRVGERIGGDAIGASIYELAEAQQSCPYHFHHGVEEWLYVIAGTPTVRTPDGSRAHRSGDLLCFPAGSDGAHAVYGPGRIMIFSVNHDRPSVSVYPDSDKLGTRPGDDADRLNFRRSDAVDYWEGE
jgi:uncharacterized cupin superfamily protein